MKLNYETEWEYQRDRNFIDNNIDDFNECVDIKKDIQIELLKLVTLEERNLLAISIIAPTLLEKLIGIAFVKYLSNSNDLNRYDLLKITYAVNIILGELVEDESYDSFEYFQNTMEILKNGYLNKDNVNSNAKNHKIQLFKQRDFINMFQIEFSHHIKEASNNFHIPFYMPDILREAINFGLENIPYLSKSNELTSAERSDIHLHLIEELSKAIAQMQPGFNDTYQQGLKMALRARLV